MNAEQYAAYLLQRKRYTRHELCQKMKQKQFREDAITRVLDLLEEYKYIDDEKYALHYAQTQSEHRGKSRRQIKLALAQKGVASHSIGQALDGIEDASGIKQQVEKFFRTNDPSDKDAVMKIKRRLYGKGFSYGEIAAAVQRYAEGEEDWTE